MSSTRRARTRHGTVCKWPGAAVAAAVVAAVAASVAAAAVADAVDAAWAGAAAVRHGAHAAGAERRPPPALTDLLIMVGFDEVDPAMIFFACGAVHRACRPFCTTA
jgi:hypothetical protein